MECDFVNFEDGNTSAELVESFFNAERIQGNKEAYIGDCSDGTQEFLGARIILPKKN